MRLAAHFIDNQHSASVPIGQNNAYHQADMPVRQMKNASGHAVRATYFYTAVSSLARRLGDAQLGQADDSLFESAIDRKGYITGGVGAAWRGEAFMGDYELANGGYSESCASCGMAFVEREWREGDTVEFGFPVETQRVRCDSRVKANAGRVAFQRGPIVYNFEQCDQKAPLDSVESAPTAAVYEVWMPDLCDGVYALKTADGLVAIPNFSRLNRQRCRSIVWIKELEKRK